MVVHIVQVANIAGRLVKSRPHRRGHEQGIAPPPREFAVDNRLGHDPVEVFFHGRNFGRFRMLQVQVEIGLCHGLIIRVRKPRTQLPIVRLPHFVHGLPVFLVTRTLRSCDEAGVQRSKCPVEIEPRARPLQLPIGHLAHRPLNIFTTDGRRQVRGQWQLLLGLISQRCDRSRRGVLLRLRRERQGCDEEPCDE